MHLPNIEPHNQTRPLQPGNNKLNTRLKPFVKWVGGKGQLVEVISSNYPKGLGQVFTKYAEPFVGGGAILFDIVSKFDLKEIYISDINKELISTYQIIRDNTDELSELLCNTQTEYLALDTKMRKEYFYAKRNSFNLIKKNINNDNKVECASLFIFLNKTCFNGLYRVNKNGLFNVPVGSYKNPKIYDGLNLKNISLKLSNINILYANYKESISFIDKKTFVYIDPPYRPISTTSNFVSYNEFDFNDDKQNELADFYRNIDKTGAAVILSNSDPMNIDKNDTFFDDLYAGFLIKRVKATRLVNSKAKNRGQISEILVRNF
jgi:DNA adenine methylase